MCKFSLGNPRICSSLTLAGLFDRPWRKSWWKLHLSKRDSCCGNGEQMQPECKNLGKGKVVSRTVILRKNCINVSASERKLFEAPNLYLRFYLLGEERCFMLLFPLTVLWAACCDHRWPSLGGICLSQIILSHGCLMQPAPLCSRCSLGQWTKLKWSRALLWSQANENCG